MSESIRLEHVSVNANGYEYVCDFDVFFEPLYPAAELWRPDGSDAPDMAQDEVNFYFVKISSALNLEFNSNAYATDSIDELVNLEESILAWCNTNDELHIEAFKQWKNAR
jgi:hypothetical protein